MKDCEYVGEHVCERGSAREQEREREREREKRGKREQVKCDSFVFLFPSLSFSLSLSQSESPVQRRHEQFWACLGTRISSNHVCACVRACIKRARVSVGRVCVSVHCLGTS